MAKLKAEVLHQAYKEKRVPIGTLLIASYLSAQPDWLGHGPTRQAGALHQPSFKWLLEKIAGSIADGPCQRFARDNLRRWFRRHPVDSSPGGDAGVPLF